MLFQIWIQIEFPLWRRKVYVTWSSIGFAGCLQGGDIIIGTSSHQIKPALVFEDQFFSSFLENGIAEFTFVQCGVSVSQFSDAGAIAHFINSPVGFCGWSVIVFVQGFSVNQQYFCVANDGQVLGGVTLCTHGSLIIIFMEVRFE